MQALKQVLYQFFTAQSPLSFLQNLSWHELFAARSVLAIGPLRALRRPCVYDSMRAMETIATLSPATINLIAQALAEDVGSGDATTLALVPATATGEALVASRSPGVVAGIGIAAAVFRQLDEEITVKIIKPDGERVAPGDAVLRLQGKARALLTGERVALNFLQQLSGIATETARYVERVKPHDVAILDTRKTIPNLRELQKYAVTCGGGQNHRMGLYDRVMIKDNHLSFWQQGVKRDLAAAVRTARTRYPDLAVQVEVDRPEQLAELWAEPPDWVLLDNMTPDEVGDCVARCRGRCKVEVSGGITLETVADYAAQKPDAISVGTLTHSIRSLDLGLDWISS